MKTGLLIAFLFNVTFLAHAGKLISGPMQGHTTSHSTKVWIMVKNTDSVSFTLKDPVDGTTFNQIVYTKDMPGYKEFTPITFSFMGLQADRDYNYEIKIDEDIIKGEKEISTFKNEPVQDFSFLLGSCALTPPVGLRFMHPGIEERTYKHMVEKESAFMLWLGDYLYYLKGHYSSPKGMFKRQTWKRKSNKLNRFLTSRPQYSIWDDHDYGPNNSDGSFVLKDTSLGIFKQFWPNPSYGYRETKGCFFNFTFADAEFFMTDVRFHRTLPGDSSATFLGEEQFEWLKDQLKQSNATFKFIGSGSQMLNYHTKHECYCQYDEFDELLQFLEEEKITGVIFLSGDRHHTELLKLERQDTYDLYEFTCSAITSFRRRTRRGDEKDNPVRVDGTLADIQNFGRIKIMGDKGNRTCLLQTFNRKGKLVWEYKIEETELR